MVHGTTALNVPGASFDEDDISMLSTRSRIFALPLPHQRSAR
jgi:hypothetical protein